MVPNGNNILMDMIFQYMNIKFSFLYYDGLTYWTWPNQTKENIYLFFLTIQMNTYIHVLWPPGVKLTIWQLLQTCKH